MVPLGELHDLTLRHAADARGHRRRVSPRLRHERLEPLDVRVDEGAVEAPPPLELGRERPREHDVGARPERDVQIGLLGELHALGIDHHEPRPAPTRLVDERRQVEIAPGDVVPPDDDEPRVHDRLGPNAGHRPVGAHPGLPADPAAEGLPIQEGGAQPVEEAQVHRAPREHPVGTRVVQRQDGLRPVRGDDGGEAVVNGVEGLRPADGGEAAVTLGADAAKRGAQAPGPVHPLRIGGGHLGAQHAGRVGIRPRATHANDARVLNRHGQAAGVGAIERTDACQLARHARLLMDLGIPVVRCHRPRVH